ncbi:unnamed protein product [Periconia digitata]|uniref:Uncharacterized protein n=1 Tax=Periconia digitata TaxID=1303443 RepID=A0A9W4U7D5_9PLEO|nr:unnamed protein product [Periconia digitata]
MTQIQSRSMPSPGLSPNLVVAISTGFGVVMLALIIGLVCLLIRSVRKHKRLLADLEQRGVMLARSQEDAKTVAIMRPRTVLKKSRILPFNLKTGWGALPSVETVNDINTPRQSISAPSYYAPPKPAGFVEKPKRLSWPFSARKPSGRAIRMRKLRVPALSTVIESPKPSPLVPVLSGPHDHDSTSPKQSHMRSTSDQSLLQHHPVFRNDAQPLQVDVIQAEPLRRSMTVRPVTKPEVTTRTNRSNSIADIPVRDKNVAIPRLPRPQIHARTVSMCSQGSGNAPEGGLPPPPLQVARVKAEDRRRSLLSRSPTRLSISSFESADTSILTQSSPIIRNTHAVANKVTKRDPRNIGIATPRSVRNKTVTVHKTNHALHNSIQSSIARFSSATSSTQPENQHPEFRHSLHSVSPSSQNLERTGSFAARSLRTPKRKSATFVTPYGSPEDRRKRSSILQRVSGNQGIPARQLSQASTQATSTRSSNGDPFQWDPTPMSTGKPSNLKGSPLARKGHRRQPCVRIVVEPTVLGPRSRSSSPAIMKGIQEESSPITTPAEVKLDIGLGFTNRRSLPQPPSTSIFAPDIKLGTTSIRASLTPSSPTLSMANYDHGPIGSPVLSRKVNSVSNNSSNRTSIGPEVYIPAFSNPYDNESNVPDFANAPPTFALARAPSEEVLDIDTVAGASSPFEMLFEIDSSPTRAISIEEYDPEHPQLTLHTPTRSNSKQTRTFSSPFSVIIEETPTQQSKDSDTTNHAIDSPPCSPKTIPASTLESKAARDRCSAFDLPIRQTAILEDSEAIDPALLSNEAFHSLNSPFDYKTSPSFSAWGHNSKPEARIPNSSESAKALMEPLLNAAFPSSPPMLSLPTSPSSNAVPSLLPRAPASPRPSHAGLPHSPPYSSIAESSAPALDFTNMPTLTPGLNGPRVLPARPLRSSIQELRRMNSDAEKGNGREERRYRRLCREDSIGLPGEESFMDGLDEETETWSNADHTEFDAEDYEKEEDEEEGSTWNEEKERKLVGDLLSSDWEEAPEMEQASHRHSPPAKNNAEDDDIDFTIISIQDHTSKSPALTSSPASTVYPSSPSASILATTMPAKPTNPIDRSSSIWEDGEKFWTSTPPFHQAAQKPLSSTSPTHIAKETKSHPPPPPRLFYLSSPSSPPRPNKLNQNNPPSVAPTAQSAGSSKKRSFPTTTHSSSPAPPPPSHPTSPTATSFHPSKCPLNSQQNVPHLIHDSNTTIEALSTTTPTSDAGTNRNSQSRYRNRGSSSKKRGSMSVPLSVVDTPNGRSIQVFPPGSAGTVGTVGSLYDAGGFLRE